MTIQTVLSSKTPKRFLYYFARQLILLHCSDEPAHWNLLELSPSQEIGLETHDALRKVRKWGNLS